MMIRAAGAAALTTDVNLRYRSGTRGDGASPEGDRPFLDRLDLADLTTKRLWHSPADAYEQVLGFAGDDRETLLIWHESRTEPPNLAVIRLDGGERTPLTWTAAYAGIQSRIFSMMGRPLPTAPGS